MSEKLIVCAFKCGAELPLDEMLKHHCPDAPERRGRLEERIAALQAGEVRVTSSTGGQKGSKLERYDLIPVEPLRLLARLYGKGAEKYDDNNWRKGYDWSLSYASLQRHANDFWDGVDIDPETGLPNIIAVAWHAFALAQFAVDHPDFDNRPGRPA